ncbi:hypothetical protein NAT51_14895 [Flavobacterium amniphilum]|uniref:hypothetical protein n=1 Tax=Flavobacterium amniphilum TaxID=1834035 RepID=UPI002029C982|nr:hypothetical protein [Flavobacterium amniphilum]MCL9806820.1 hypothetical protein [Flavobacterium amniphilum]
MKITVKKVKTADIEIIQSELLKFIRHKIDNLAHCNDYQNYCNDIIVIDTLQSMFFLFRAKIESKKQESSLILSPTQAVILLFCAQWQREERTEVQRIAMQKVSDVLHEKLVNI